MRKKIQDILHIECFDIYGLCEITGPGVAMDCRQHKGLHINHDFFYPEILDPITHEPMDDGELGELVFTTLEKEGMPLLRYRTKDLTSIDYSTCECGRTLPRISKFKGRTDDMKVIRGVKCIPDPGRNRSVIHGRRYFQSLSDDRGQREQCGQTYRHG